MAEINLVHVDAVMKEYVDPSIKTHPLEMDDLLARIDQGQSKPTNGRGRTIVNRVRRSASFGAPGESGALPTAGRSEFNQFKIFPEMLSAGWRVSGRSIRNCNGNEKALINILSYEVDAALVSFKAKVNDLIPLDGTGEIARVRSVSGSTVTCTNTAAEGNMFGNIKILPNATVNFYDPVGQAYRTTPTNSVVTGSPDPALGTFTVDSLSAGVAAGDRVVYAGCYNRYPHGFDANINNGSGMIQGQSRSQNPDFRSVVLDATNADPTVQLFNKFRALFKFRHKNPDKTTMVSSIGVKTKYEEQGHTLSRFNRDGSGGTMKLDFGNVQHGPVGSGWEDYTVCQPNICWFIDFTEFSKYVLTETQSYQVDGKSVWLGVNSSGQRLDVVEGWVFAEFDLGTELPLAHGRINNIGTSDHPLAQLAF